MEAVIRSNAGVVIATFPVAHVGVTAAGTVQVDGDPTTGHPYSIEVRGRDLEGRLPMELLTAAAEIAAKYGRIERS